VIPEHIFPPKGIGSLEETMDRREEFLSEIMENILLPYESSKEYEEEIIGEFENRFEEDYFDHFSESLERDGLVLDLACGDGRHTLKLSEKAVHVIALDISINNLRKAKEKCKAKENITFIKGDMFALPFPESTFDGIWLSQAFEYVPPDRRQEFLSSIARILKPEGLLYMSVETWIYPSIWKSLRELLRDLKLFCYWKFLKRKPLLWGEFLYYLSPEMGWHYHVHTDKWTLCRLLHRYGFMIEKISLYNGYIYVLCYKATRK